MNHCIKTGADVWDSAMGCVIHCDAYFMPEYVGGASGTWLFRYVEPFIFPDKQNKPKVLRAACHFWIDNEEIWQQQHILQLDSAQIIAVPSRLVGVRINTQTGELLNDKQPA